MPKPKTMNTVLRSWRIGEKLSKSELAETLGISVSHLTEIELGASCSLEVAAKIERVTEGFVRATHLQSDRDRILKARAKEAPPKRSRPMAKAERGKSAPA